MRGCGAAALWLLAGLACGGGPAPAPSSPCGPTEATVKNVVDGDTIDLESGERIRYLLVDTPETTNGKNDCYGVEAREFNRSLLVGKAVTLAYDAECKDRFGRLLAYVSVEGREANRLMVERGFACVLFIPPSGETRRAEFEALAAQAKAARRGLWGACEAPCK